MLETASPRSSRLQSCLVILLAVVLPTLSYPLSWFAPGTMPHRFELSVPIAVLYLIGLLAIVVLHLGRGDVIHLPRTQIDRPVLAVVGVGMISVMLSSNVYFSVSAFVLLLANVALLYVIAIWFHLRYTRALTWAWVGVATVVAVHALWLRSQGHFPVATIGNRDWVACYLAVSVMVGLPLWGDAVQHKWRIVPLSIAYLLIGGAMYVCDSLGAWIGLGVAVLLCVFRILWTERRIAALGVTGLAVIALAAVVLVGHESVADLWSRNVRPPIWKGVLAMVRDSPLIGKGLGTFTYTYASYRPPEYHARPQASNLTDHAHNEFLEIAAESGFFGLALMLWLLGVVFVRGWQGMAREGPHRMIVLGAWGGLVAMLVHNLFDINLRMPPNQTLLWLLMGLVVRSTRGEVRNRETVRPTDSAPEPAVEPPGLLSQHMGRWTTVVGSVVLIGLLGYFQVYRPVLAHVYFRRALIERGTEPIQKVPSDRIQRAMENYLQCLRIDPYRVIAWYRLAYLCAGFEETDEQAIDYYEQVRLLAPDYGDVNSNLALLYLKRGKEREALPHLQRAIELNPYSVGLQQTLGQVFDNLGLERELKDQVILVLQLESTNAWANYVWQTRFRLEPLDSMKPSPRPKKPVRPRLTPNGPAR